MNRPRHRGFTLIELLAVIAIVVILMSLLFPVFGRLRRMAVRVTDLSNLRQFVIGCASFASDNEGMWPMGTKDAALRQQYCDDIVHFNYDSFTNIQHYVNDSTKKTFACTSFHNNTNFMAAVGVTHNMGSYAPQPGLTGNAINGTSLGWNYMVAHIGPRCGSASWNAWNSSGGLITNLYKFPLRTGDRPTSRTLATCVAWVPGDGFSWVGRLPHLDPDDQVRFPPQGYPRWGVPDFPGINVGYTDGGARWVHTEELGVVRDVDYIYFDATR